MYFVAQPPFPLSVFCPRKNRLQNAPILISLALLVHVLCSPAPLWGAMPETKLVFEEPPTRGGDYGNPIENVQMCNLHEPPILSFRKNLVKFSVSAELSQDSFGMTNREGYHFQANNPLAASSNQARAQTEMRRGPLHGRNQFPIALPFFSFSAEPAATLPKYQLRVELSYDRANTFVKSGGIVENLDSSGNRNPFTTETVQRILQNNPNADAFLIDAEVNRWTLRLEYAPLEKFSLAAELPVLRFGGQFMDPMIESFHKIFGFPDGDRPEFFRHDANVFLYFDQQLFFGDKSDLAGTGIGDVSLFAKRQIIDGNKLRPVLALAAGLELPTGNEKKLRGNGSFDFGFNLCASWAWQRNWLDLNVGITKPGRWEILPELELTPIYAMMLSYEHSFGKRVSFLIQDRHTTSPLRGVTSEGIRRMAHEITAGVKIDGSHGLRWSIAVTENYAYFNSSPDLGMQVGVEIKK
ncbi:hypothetical protein DCC62_02305 [candidate division KSB1 bacterium]|nr:MAG: hypothetical protein DCC62_02305 [candidate division KSB1 bacterium]